MLIGNATSDLFPNFRNFVHAKHVLTKKAFLSNLFWSEPQSITNITFCKANYHSSSFLYIYLVIFLYPAYHHLVSWWSFIQCLMIRNLHSHWLGESLADSDTQPILKYEGFYPSKESNRMQGHQTGKIILTSLSCANNIWTKSWNLYNNILCGACSAARHGPSPMRYAPLQLVMLNSWIGIQTGHWLMFILQEMLL